MKQIDNSNLSAGVRINREYSGGVEYHGTESDLIAAGILKPEWLVGLEKHSRQIALKPEGGFVLVGEGKGNRLTIQHRHHGAFTVKRLPDGLVSVFKYRTKAEEKERNRLLHEEYLREPEQETWQRAKVAHSNTDFVRRWKECVNYQIESIEQLIDGRSTFEHFPEIRIQPADVAAAKKAIEELQNVLRWAEPKIRDKVVRGNVIALNGHTYRNMGAASA